MNPKSIRSLLVVALTLMLVSLIGLPKTFAQSGDDVIQIELVGEIEALTSSTVTINGQVIDISAAQLNTALAVGEMVKVEGTLESDGSITAREVYAVEEGDLLPGEVEIIGPITALDGDTMTIGGLVINVAEAELSDDLTLELDAVVKVHMSLVADTAGVESWVAREVQADDTSDNSQDANSSDDSSNDNALPGEFEIVGTLTQTDGDTIVVSGLTIDITTAEIKGTLVVGALVKVHLSSVDGVFVAREIELHDSQSSNNDDSEDDGSDDNTNNNSNANSNSNNSNDDNDSNANNSNDDGSDDSNANNSNEDDGSNTNEDDDSNVNNSNDDGSNNNEDDSNANNSNDDDSNNNEDDSSGSNNNDNGNDD